MGAWGGTNATGNYTKGKVQLFEQKGEKCEKGEKVKKNICRIMPMMHRKGDPKKENARNITNKISRDCGFHTMWKDCKEMRQKRRKSAGLSVEE